MEKVIKDGKVALLISGTGWSTWNESDEMLYDPTIVNILMDDTLSRNAQCNRIVEGVLPLVLLPLPTLFTLELA